VNLPIELVLRPQGADEALRISPGFNARRVMRAGVALLVVLTGFSAHADSEGQPISSQEASRGAAESAGVVEVQSTPSPVNVVIFLIDALRADRLGTYGYDRLPTSPRIDALASQGVVFEQAHSAAPWTLPSVASLMTGVYACEHQVLNDRDRLGESLDTITTHLKRLGYAAHSLFSNPFAGPRFGVGRGFDSSKRSKHNDGGKVSRVLAKHNVQPPYFFYIHNAEPHNPYDAPAHTEGFPDVPESVRTQIENATLEYKRLTRRDFNRRRTLGAVDNSASQDRQMAILNVLLDDYNDLYDASVRQADGLVGSVIDALKARGDWRNTLFILLSDHGEEMNDHGGWFHDQSVYQELTHVPLIIRFPDGEYGGKRMLTTVSLVDVLPTVLEYVGAADAAAAPAGRSLMPAIRGVQSAAEDIFVPSMRINRKKFYRPWKESRGDVNIVVLQDRWKGIWNVEPGTLELYDLSHDRWEQKDVSKARPDIALSMRSFAAEWLKECRSRREDDSHPAAESELDEQTLRSLRELGYVD